MKKGKRYALANACDDSPTVRRGTRSSDRYWNQCARNLKIRERLNKILAERTGQPQKIARDVERDYWLDAQEAKEYGLIDEVLEKRPSIA